jgi:hypothetical protein
VTGNSLPTRTKGQQSERNKQGMGNSRQHAAEGKQGKAATHHNRQGDSPTQLLTMGGTGSHPKDQRRSNTNLAEEAASHLAARRR